VIPLVARFPALERIPRVPLGSFPSPVQRYVTASGATLWIKRDDLNAPAFGGNKVRSLEYLLGRVRPGDEVLTIGGIGSTHVLTTAAHARALGARTIAIRWPHEMNAVSHQVAAYARELCDRVVDAPHAVAAVMRALLARARGRAHWVPFGGTSPLGALGHVNAALELADQVRAGLLPVPARVVVPLGTGGTAAGLALGFRIAGLDVVLECARVGPRIATPRARVLRLARRTAALIERVTGERLSAVPAELVRVTHNVYGGAYGRPFPPGTAAAAALEQATGIRLDATYSAKALAAALASHAGLTLFWLTFDGRWIAGERAYGVEGP